MKKSVNTSVTVTAFLEQLEDKPRASLEHLRKTLLQSVPDGEECFSYGLPAIRWKGKPLVAYGASAEHCAFYPMSPKVIVTLKKELENYSTSKGTIRFLPGKKLPTALVKQIIGLRMSEVQGKRKPARKVADAEVEEFLKRLDHPLKREIISVRQLILNVDPSISEGIKWNAPSFRTTEYFATVNLRSTDTLQLILHLGAKARKDIKSQPSIDDPEDLLRWLAKDRCMATIGAKKVFTANCKAIANIVRQWIRLVK